MSAEDEEPDGLVQASFTIKASNSDQVKDDPYSIRNFPVLEKYEATKEVAEQRRTNFVDHSWTIEWALETTLKGLFDGIIQDLKIMLAEIHEAKLGHYIPGSSVGAKTERRRLPAAAIIGPQYSSQFRDTIKKSLVNDENTYWVELESRECSNLAATLQLLLARIFSQVSKTESRGSLTALSKLTSLPESTTIILYLPSLAQQKYTLLNDLIKSIHESSQLSKFPRFIALFGVEGGSPTLDEKLDNGTMQLLDLKRLYTPLSAKPFEDFMQHFFLAKENDRSRLWPGPAVLDFLHYQYFDRGFSLDRLASTMELVFHHHFTARPLSSLIDLSEARPLGSEDYHPIFHLRARSQYIHQARDGSITIEYYSGDDYGKDIPDPKKLAAICKELFVEDELVLGHAFLDIAELVKEGREQLKAAIHILHTLQLQIQGVRLESSIKTNRRLRSSTLGGLTFEVVSGFDMSRKISRMTNELRKASFKVIASCLVKIEEGKWTEDMEDAKLFKATLASHQSKIQEAIVLDDDDAESRSDDVGKSTQERGKGIQKRWLQIEEAEAVKKAVADWLGSLLNTWISFQPPVPSISIYDFTSYINQLTDPSTRSETIAALHDPRLVLSNSKGTSPDICKLYEMYRSAGRMINLADWYQAFAQSIKADQKSLGKRQRQQMDSEEYIQARFALSVNEMGKMGFLKKTRRKVDHVLKVVHDLPPKES